MLRHNWRGGNIRMDSDAYVCLATCSERMRVPQNVIEELVSSPAAYGPNGPRYEIACFDGSDNDIARGRRGKFIRARHGHSRAEARDEEIHTPVRARDLPTPVLAHGTSTRGVSGILTSGLIPGGLHAGTSGSSRNHVFFCLSLIHISEPTRPY